MDDIRSIGALTRLAQAGEASQESLTSLNIQLARANDLAEESLAVAHKSAKHAQTANLIAYLHVLETGNATEDIAHKFEPERNSLHHEILNHLYS